MDFHLSSGGSDSNDGSASKPFLSPGRAQEAVRDFAGKEPVTVWFHGGTYRLSKTLVFSPADGGSADAPVTYKAWGEEEVFVTGSAALENLKWEPFRDGIFRAALDFPGGKIDQLFVNRRLMDRARFPNRDDDSSGKPGFTCFAGELINDEAEKLRPDPDGMSFTRMSPRGAYFNSETFSKREWKHPERAVVHSFQGMNWGSLQFRLADIDREHSILWFGEGGQQIGCWTCPVSSCIWDSSRFYVENVFEELDVPGEWYYDDEEKQLYLYPPADIDLNTAFFEAPLLKNLIEVRGSQRNPAGFINFSGLSFSHALTTYFEQYEVPSNGDWALHRGGAFFFEGAVHCTVENCAFTDLGGNAVFFSGYNRDNLVEGSYFTRLGESAVCIVGNYNTTNGTQKNFPFRCKVSNCRMHRLGLYGKQVAGVFIAVSSRISVSHCHIFDVPRAAVCLNDGFQGGHVFEHNLIHDTCLETSDHGPFNSWARDVYYCSQHSHSPQNAPPVCHRMASPFIYQPETIIVRGNMFRDKRGWGIDLDDGSSNFHIYNNVCVGISIKLRDGVYRTVENNIFYKGANAPSFHMGHIDNHDIYRRNIVVMDTGHADPEHDADFKANAHNGAVYELHRPPLSGPWFLENDNNLFWSNIGIFKAKASVYTPEGICAWTVFDLKSWRTMGYDVHSEFADPLFKDPEAGNFSVSEDSPAVRLGFKNFPMNQFGLSETYTKKYERIPFYPEHTRLRPVSFAL
jgi:hypothetical protein